MRILVHGINHRPELVGIGKYTGEMAAWLAARGHEVEVVTAPPYYPAWRVDAPYHTALYSGEIGPEGRVLRCPLFVPPVPQGLNRVVHLGSFALTSFPALIGRARAFRPDVIWVAAPALTNAPGALLAARLCGAVAWLHVQDFELEAARRLGMLDFGPLGALARRGEEALFGAFDRVSTICGKMRDGLLARKVAPERALLFPNWVDTDRVRPGPASAAMRARLGAGPDDVLAVYSGNMGLKQGLNTLLEAALLPQSRHVRFALCGDGAARPRLERGAAGVDHVRLFPLLPDSEFQELLNAADIHLVPQRADAADLVMPSKLTGILASGGAVLATANEGSELWAAVHAAGGATCPPDDPAAFADALAALSRDRAALARARTAARAYAVERLGRDRILGRFEADLERAREEHRCRS